MGVASCLSVILEVKLYWSGPFGSRRLSVIQNREVVLSLEVSNVLHYTKFHSVP